MPVEAAAAALRTEYDTRGAAHELVDALGTRLGGPCDLLVFFASFHHRSLMAEASEVLREGLTPRCMVGTTGESVIGGSTELEGRAGLSALALRMPEALLTPFAFDPAMDASLLQEPQSMAQRLGLADGEGAVLLLADPFTTPIAMLLPALDALGPAGSPRVIGGLASGASQPGQNLLVVGETIRSDGAVGVTIGGPVDVDTIVSQGCRPVGAPMVITKAAGNVILELGGRPALTAMRQLAESLAEHERELLRNGLLVGLVLNEYKDRFGRDDFLVRAILGTDQRTSGVAIGDTPRTGQTMQLHVRDASTATEDLQLLLDAEQLHEPAVGALLFDCNGRGTRLFSVPDHDAALIRRRLDDLPLAGFFAAGEIGPIGGRTLVHGHTACVALFR